MIDNMFCPACKAELIVTGQARLETLCEHIDQNGEILTRKRHLKFWKRDDNVGGWIHHIPGIHMFIYTIKSFRRKLGFYKIDHPAILRELALHEWQKKDWWRRWAHPIKKWLYNRKVESCDPISLKGD